MQLTFIKGFFGIHSNDLLRNNKQTIWVYISFRSINCDLMKIMITKEITVKY